MSRETGLNWRERPETVAKAVDSAYVSLSRHESSVNWLYNGYESYPFGGINQFHFIQNMITQGYPEQKEYFIMDIGAGCFQWGRAMAEHINNCHFPDDITVHVYSLRAEQNNELQEFRNGICLLHEIGSCKIEELEAEFPTLGNKVDFIISSWCFRHLADPVGTFVQAHNLLKPLTGVFMFDGFFMGLSERHEDVCDPQYEKWTSEHYAYWVPELLLNTDSAYFEIHDDNLKRLNAYILQKMTSSQLKLPLRYIGCKMPPCTIEIQCVSDSITKFLILPEWKKFDDNNMREQCINDGTRRGRKFYLNSIHMPGENAALLELMRPSVTRLDRLELAKHVIPRRERPNIVAVPALASDSVETREVSVVANVVSLSVFPALFSAQRTTQPDGLNTKLREELTASEHGQPEADARRSVLFVSNGINT